MVTPYTPEQLLEAIASLEREIVRLQEAAKDEKAWLIENAPWRSPRYFMGFASTHFICSCWGTVDQAIRFCRKQDAETVLRFIEQNQDLEGLRATDHLWLHISK